jgi:tetratricopeptide (TPR) repeat protein
MFRKTSIIVLAIMAISGARAGLPIEVEYGRGRNMAAIKFWTEAEAQLKKGDVENARRNVDAAIRSDPTLYPAFYTRAKVYMLLHKYELAIQDASEALRQDRTFIEAALLRAKLNGMLGRYDACLKEINHVVAIKPRVDGRARAYSDRAWLRATCPVASFRNGKEAVKDATFACKLMQWKDEDCIDTLAAAYAEIGDFDSAIKYEQQAMGMKDITPDDAKTFRYHLESFKKHQPIRSAG